MPYVVFLFLLYVMARGTFPQYVNLAAPGFFPDAKPAPGQGAAPAPAASAFELPSVPSFFNLPNLPWDTSPGRR